MTFAVNAGKQKIEKHALVIVRPRSYLEDWEDEGGGIYSTQFSLGRVTRMWNVYGSAELTRVTALASVISGKFFHDTANGILYVGAASLPTNRTAEFEIHLSDKQYTGPCDPLDADSEVVDWRPYLAAEPVPKNGTRDSLVGYSPLFTSSVEINNATGWLNEMLHECSFNFASVSGYILANAELEHGVINSDVQATLLGYVGANLEERNKVVSLPVTDFWRILDQPAAPSLRFYESEYAGAGYVADPAACGAGAEWYVRKVRGALNGHVPVNIDYAATATASTSNNRVWITDELESLGEASYTYVVDHLAANTATKTFFLTTHQLEIGDTMEIVNDGVTRYITVIDLNRAAKWIQHDDLTGRTIVALDTATRHFIGYVNVEDEDGLLCLLKPGRDWVPFYGPANGLGNVKGFELVDDFEAAAGFTANGGIFDPNIHRIYCRIYGPKEAEKYADGVTDVGAPTDHGGSIAGAHSIIFHLLTWAGLPKAIIDQVSFAAVGAGAHTLGMAIPSAAEGSPATFKAEVQRVLDSVLWRLGFAQSGNDIKIGLVALGPLPAQADYSADSQEAQLVSYEQEYGDVFHSVRMQYAISEFRFASQRGPQEFFLTSEVNRTRDLHFITKVYNFESLHFGPVLYNDTEAQEVCDHLALTMSDRRGFYTYQLEQRFLDKVNIGTAYDLSQDQLPGFPFIFRTPRTRMLSVIEVQKSTLGVTLVAEDQKGIEDNAGDW